MKISKEFYYDYGKEDLRLNIPENSNIKVICVGGKCISLTPPTADEVCQALSEHFKEKVVYVELERAFKFTEGNRKGGYLTRCNKYHNTYGITGYALPPHLITMIGRFYEVQDESN